MFLFIILRYNLFDSNWKILPNNSTSRQSNLSYLTLPSKSLPSLFIIDKLIANESFIKYALFKKHEKTFCDMGTQTQMTINSFSSIGHDSEESSLSAKWQFTHEASTDSGIDSDNAQQKLIRPKKYRAQ